MSIFLRYISIFFSFIYMALYRKRVGKKKVSRKRTIFVCKGNEIIQNHHGIFQKI